MSLLVDHESKLSSLCFQVWFKNRRARRKRQRSGSQVKSPSPPRSAGAEKTLLTTFLWTRLTVLLLFRDIQRSADLLKGTSAGWKLLWCDCCWSNITFYNCDDAFRGCCESPRLQAVLQFILYSVNYSFLALNYFEFLCNLLNQCLKYRLLCVGLKYRHRFVTSSVFFKK